MTEEKKVAEYTKGKWELELRPADNCHRIRAGNEVIADVFGTIQEDEGNAQLICALHNMSVSINPENPMAVADNMGDIVEALRAVTKDGIVYEGGGYNEVFEALAKIKEK